MSKRVSRIDAMDLTPVAEPPASPAVASEPTAGTSAPVTSVAPLSGADVLECPANLLGSMPLWTTLRCSLGEREFLVTTSRAEHAAAVAAGAVVLTGGELGALALGAAHERVWNVTLEDWLDRKLGEPTFRITVDEALAGYVPREHIDPWTIGQLFRWLGVSLHEVRTES
jgi:hypothetical protein